MKKIYTYIAVFTLIVCLPGSILGQVTTQKSLYSIEKIEKVNPWLNSENGAGLIFNKTDNFSTIGSYMFNESGTLQNYIDPEKYNYLGIETKSYVKAKNVFYYGQMGYEYGVRQNQAWLGTVIPNSNFNTINDSIPGKVLSENYKLAAKVGYSINDHVALGLGFNYFTSTSAKRVDGRNENTLSSLTISPGVLFNSKNLNAGFNLTYRKNSEKVDFSFIGDETGKYLLYFDGGLWMHTVSGLTNTTIIDRMYMEQYLGGSVQAELKMGKFSFFNDLAVGYSFEDDHEGSNLTKRYAFVDGLKYNYKGVLSLKCKKMDQYVNVNYVNDQKYSYSVINNYEAIPNETNSWAYFEYGKVLRYTQEVQQYGVEYQNFIKRADFDYSWILSLGYKYFSIDKNYKVYPASYHQDYNKGEIYGSITKNFVLGEGDRLDLSVGMGKVTADGTLMDASNPLTAGALIQNTRLLVTDFAFNASDLAKWNIGVKYQNGFGKKGRSAYAAFKYSNVKAVSTPDLSYSFADFTDKTRDYLEITLGFNF